MDFDQKRKIKDKNIAWLEESLYIHNVPLCAYRRPCTKLILLSSQRQRRRCQDDVNCLDVENFARAPLRYFGYKTVDTFYDIQNITYYRSRYNTDASLSIPNTVENCMYCFAFLTSETIIDKFKTTITLGSFPSITVQKFVLSNDTRGKNPNIGTSFNV